MENGGKGNISNNKGAEAHKSEKEGDHEEIISFILDRNGRILWADRKLAEMLGYREDITGADFQDFTDRRSMKELLRMIDGVLHGGVRISAIDIVSSDGGFFRIHIFAVPELSAKPEKLVKCHVLTIREPNKSDDGPEKLHSGLESILNSSIDAILITDRSGRVVLHSPINKQSIDFLPEIVAGRKIDELMPGDFAGKFYEVLERLRNGGHAEFEFSFDRDGEKRWLNAKLSPVVVKGEFDGVTAIIRDVTEVRRLNELLMIVNGVLRAVIKSRDVKELIRSVSRELEDLKYPVCVVAIRSGDKFITTSKELGEIGINSESLEHISCVIESMKTQKTVFRNGNEEKCRTCIFDQGKETRYRYIFPISASGASYGGLAVFSFEALPEEEVEILEKMAKDLALSIRAIKIDELEKFAIKQVEENLIDMLLVIDRIRNPLTVISYLAETGKDEKGEEVYDRIMDEVKKIVSIIETLEMRWNASEDLIRSIRQLIHR